jgi:hypothetical protein
MLNVWHGIIAALQPRVTMPRARDTGALALLAGDVEAGVGSGEERCGDLQVCVDYI